MYSKARYSLIFLLLIFGCDRNSYNQGTFSSDVKPLEGFNTSYDDMNMDLKMTFHSFDFIYSSSYPGHGQYFSLISRTLSTSFKYADGRAIVAAFKTNKNFHYGSGINPLAEKQHFVDKVNNSCNQKGPYTWEDADENRFLLYSSDCDGQHSIFLYHEPITTVNGKLEPSTLRLLENNANEMYPSFYGKEFIKNRMPDQTEFGNPEKLLFTSDKDGVFDIYEMTIPQDMDPVTFLQSDNFLEAKKLSLNSSSNDHAPAVFGDVLVFASDRPGGFGGYDLYWSKHVNGNWTEPVNFGERINTSFDEFRPVVYDNEYYFTNRLLVFSSDRPGGKGGFDLYHVGVGR